jgi:hypothetical protein
MKFSHECCQCFSEWKEQGINHLYCKECACFYNPNKVNSDLKREDSASTNLSCICNSFEKDDCKENVKEIKSLKTYSKCDNCDLFIQGFFYSEFFCDVCKYKENIDGLQDISNNKCFCSKYLKNENYEKEIEFIGSNKKLVLNFVCNKNNCLNIWSSNPVLIANDNLNYFSEECR